MHIYENPYLKFSELQEMFTKLCYGEIQFTEKFDGINLLLSYSTRDGEARAVRNGAQMRQFGLTADQMRKYFLNRSKFNENVVNCITEAIKNFGQFAQTLSIKQQIKLFGQNKKGEPTIFYNCDIINPKTPNLLEYNGKYMVFHRTGHRKINDFTQRVEFFMDEPQIEQFFALILANEGFKPTLQFKINEKMRFEHQKTKNLLDSFLRRLQNLQKKYDLGPKTTILEYMIASLDPEIALIFTLSAENHVNLIKKIIADANHGQLIKAPKMKEVLKFLDIDKAQQVRTFLESEKPKEMFKKTMYPMEILLHNFSVDLLNLLNSAIFTEPDKFNDGLRARLTNISSNLQDREEQGRLQGHFDKIGDIDKLSLNIEGIVFPYDGHIYKLTGNFAPVNQILGYYKYKDTDDQFEKGEFDVELKKIQGRLAIIPGSFKPPHRGHIEMIKHYLSLDNVEKVMLIISRKPREIKHPKTKQVLGHVSYELSQKLFGMYLANENIRQKVSIVKSSPKGPVADTYEYVKNQAQSGDSLVLGVSGKDRHRFKNLQINTPAGVNVDVGEVAKPITYRGNATPLSGTELRSAIARGDKQEMVHYIPKKSMKDIKNVMRILFGYKMIKEELEDKKKAKRPPSESTSDKKLTNFLDLLILREQKELEEMSAASAGAVQGAATKGPWENLDEDEENLEEDFEYDQYSAEPITKDMRDTNYNSEQTIGNAVATTHGLGVRESNDKRKNHKKGDKSKNSRINRQKKSRKRTTIKVGKRNKKKG